MSINSRLRPVLHLKLAQYMTDMGFNSLYPDIQDVTDFLIRHPFTDALEYFQLPLRQIVMQGFFFPEAAHHFRSDFRFDHVFPA